MLPDKVLFTQMADLLCFNSVCEGCYQYSVWQDEGRKRRTTISLITMKLAWPGAQATMGGQHYPGSASSQDPHAQTSDSVSEVATTAWYPLTTVNVTTDTPQVKLSVAIGKMSRNVQEVDQKQQLHQGKTSRRHGLGHPALNLPSTCPQPANCQRQWLHCHSAGLSRISTKITSVIIVSLAAFHWQFAAK